MMVMFGTVQVFASPAHSRITRIVSGLRACASGQECFGETTRPGGNAGKRSFSKITSRSAMSLIAYGESGTAAELIMPNVTHETIQTINHAHRSESL